MTTQIDPRWYKLQQHGVRCGTRHEFHYGTFDLSAEPDMPVAWPHEPSFRNNSELTFDEDFLSEDFCIVRQDGELHYMIRCILPIPLIDVPQDHGDALFSYGAWSTLSKASFETYIEGFNDGVYDDDGPWFGWLMSTFTAYEFMSSPKCNVYPRSNRMRPWIELQDMDHPLAQDQRNGITFSRLMEIYALSGHDLKAALADA